MGFRLACAILVPLLFSPALAEAPTPSDVTFDERVAAQRAIEQVYWSHRIWPKENAAPKPPLSAVLTEAAIRAKVEDYLRKSNALDRIWHRPITGTQLQAELDRLVRDSKDPAMLGELFAALGNDASLIAETLGRQTLVDRLLRGWYASDARFHADLKRRAQEALASCASVGCMKTMGGRYVEATWRRRAGPQDLRAGAIDGEEWDDLLDRWAKRRGETEPGSLEETAEAFSIGAVLAQQADSLTVASVVWDKRPFDSWWEAERRTLDASLDALVGTYAIASPAAGGCTVDTWADLPHRLEPRENHTAVWTGSEMIVWGGSGEGGSLSSGGRYTPATDSWVRVSRDPNAPMGRFGHTSVWTGTEMIVWGGEAGAPGQQHTLFQDGGRYNPATDAWLPTSLEGSVPQPRRSHVAVWTGTEMIVWGGVSDGTLMRTGGRYIPSSDTWLSTAEARAPVGRYFPTAVWTGSEMVVWGGAPIASPAYQTGGRYNPSLNSWQPTAIDINTPPGVFGHTAVWTGSKMIVWGGTPSVNVVDTGGRYDPSTDSWLPTSNGAGTPSARFDHTAIWTGTEMVVWGGADDNGTDLDTGCRYRPDTDTWVSTSRQNAGARAGHTAVWSGTEMIVWGGRADGTALNSGGRYAPSSNSWVAIDVPSVVEPVARTDHSTVWTGTEMIVWGGMIRDSSVIASGGRYSPVTDAWVPTRTSGAPPRRYYHTAVWTGTEMIVWGGYDGSGYLDSGGRYDPSSNDWHTTARNGSVPTPRIGHLAVWSGTEMIVWGGNIFTGYTNTGGRYEPTSNSWAPTSTLGAPTPRSRGSAVWADSEMIVWSGQSTSGPSNSGGRYRPSTDSWQATSQGTNVPEGRYDHTAVWTGTEMIVWGGLAGPSSLRVNSGGRYDPAGDSWTPTSISPSTPSVRASHTAVWTGTEMIVWGGIGPTALCNDGARYNPSSDAWQTTSTAGAVPIPRVFHGAVWTGSEMVVWGGSNGGSENGPSVLGTGARYCADSCAAPATLYQDLDADGYGDGSVSQITCAEPSGWTALAGDCDDSDATIHPGAVETCNLLDDDCDGAIDGADTDGDGIRNACDDCALEFDPEQSDFDHDGQGDLCDLDDGVVYLVRTDKAHLRWQPELGPDHWNVYEGDLTVLITSGEYTQAPGSNPLAARRCGLVDSFADDLVPVPVGAAKFSLVTGVTAGIEGSLGTNSQNVERTNANPCP